MRSRCVPLPEDARAFLEQAIEESRAVLAGHRVVIAIEETEGRIPASRSGSIPIFWAGSCAICWKTPRVTLRQEGASLCAVAVPADGWNFAWKTKARGSIRTICP